jgi:hypothetical protein
MQGHDRVRIPVRPPAAPCCLQPHATPTCYQTQCLTNKHVESHCINPAMSDISFYPHPLPDRAIRLLNIEPGDSDSPLQCTLQETLLETTTTPYYALSYVWGSDQHLVPITCNCQIHYITPNLHSVLLEYRSRDMGVSLWVDALCINQNDTAERTSQVRMMQEIYSRAACVVVWLGEADEAIKPALRLLKEINAPWATMTDHQGREIPLFTGGDHQSHDAYVAGYVPDSYFDALAGFLLRPWFGRIWMYASSPIPSISCIYMLTRQCPRALVCAQSSHLVWFQHSR